MSKRNFTFYMVMISECLDAAETLIDLLDLMPWLPRHIGVMYSYFYVRSEPKTFLIASEMLRECNFKVMLDSGAFNIVTGELDPVKFVKYMDEYARFLNEYGEYFDYYVTMDVPVPAHVAGKYDSYLSYVYKTIEYTLKLALKLRDTRKLVVAVQGWYPDEYAICVRLLKEHGLIKEYVAVGGAAARKALGLNEERIREMTRILETVRGLIPSRTKVHGFAMSLRYLQDYRIRRLVDSADSAGYRKGFDWGGRLDLLDISIIIPVLRTACRELEKSGDIDNAYKIRKLIDKLTDKKTLIKAMILTEIYRLVKNGIIRPE